MSGRTNVDQTVKERRLRPIYEFLDSGNNKRVVQEVDRLLKKQPDFCCAKVLKALALLRLGKTADCLAILDPIVDEIPTDDNTIQAVIICYRELGKPSMVCQLLEKASKIEQSEDLLTNCFMAYVRVTNYVKQHQVAMNLYKLFPKTPYFSWAIMSLYVKAEFDSGPSVRVSLPLAERMMTKFIEDNKVESEHELWLYALILLKQGNFGKVLELIDKYDESKIPALAQYFKRKKNECLEMTGQAEALADYMEASILQNLDNWSLYSDYVTRFGVCETERVQRFLEQVLDQTGPQLPHRALLLAYLLLHKCLLNQSIVPTFDVFLYLHKYVVHYGSKASFFMDLVHFFSSLTTNELKNKCVNVVHEALGAGALNCIKTKDIQAELNMLYTRRYFERGQGALPVRVLNVFQTRMSSYLHAREKQIDAGIPWPLKEGPQDEFISLATLDLLDTLWESNAMWVGLFKCFNLSVEDPRRGTGLHAYEHGSDSGNPDDHLAHSQFESSGSDKRMGDSTANLSAPHERSLLNGLASTSLEDRKSFLATDEDFPLLLCLASLHYGLDKSPTNSQIRIILVKTYIRCGAIGAAMEVLGGLDLKHIQLESLGYVYLWKLLSLGHYMEGFAALRSLDTFYSTFEKESMEHVLAAYKYGSWEQVLEFMNFRKSLHSSVQCALVQVEKRLLDLVMDASGHTQLVCAARKMEFDLQSMCLDVVDHLTDSRDLAVLVVFRDQPLMAEWKEISLAADKRKFKIRALILTLTTDSILLADELVLNQDVTERISDFERKLELLRTECTAHVSNLCLNQITVDGMWPPRLVEYLKSGCTELLLNVMALLPAATRPGTPFSLSGYAVTFRECLNKILSSLPQFRAKDNPLCLANAASYLESLSEIVETLSIVAIHLAGMSAILKRSIANSKSKKKKNSNMAWLNPESLGGLGLIISASSLTLNNLEGRLWDLIGTLNANYPNSWDVMLPFWETKVHQDLLCDILPFSTPIIIAKIRASYSKSATQMSYLIKSKLKLLDSLLEDLPTLK